MLPSSVLPDVSLVQNSNNFLLKENKLLFYQGQEEKLLGCMSLLDSPLVVRSIFHPTFIGTWLLFLAERKLGHVWGLTGVLLTQHSDFLGLSAFYFLFSAAIYSQTAQISYNEQCLCDIETEYLYSIFKNKTLKNNSMLKPS